MQGELAGARLEHMAFGGDDVTQVPFLEISVHLFTHGITRDVDLETAGGVLQRGKAGLAHDALEHHAAGNRGWRAVAGRDLFFELFLGLAVEGLRQVGGTVGGLEIVREGHALALGLGGAQGFQFLAAFGNELVFVGGGNLRGLLLVGHGKWNKQPQAA